MPVFKKIKAKAKSSRGGGEEFILKQFDEMFDEFKAEFDGADDKQTIIDALNTAVDGAGDALAEDDKTDWQMARSDFSADDVKSFVNAIKPWFDPTDTSDATE